MKRIRKALSVIFVLVLVLQAGAVGLNGIDLSLIASAADGGNLYVSTVGNDSWSGKLAEPNADRTDGPLASLYAAKQVLKNNGTDNATVWIRGGTYTLNTTLVFDSSDSKNITYSAYNGENVHVSGGYALDNWSCEYVNGNPAWVTDVDPSAIEGEINTLYSDKGMLQNTRLPETGYYYANGADDADANYPDSDSFKQNNSFYYNGSDISDFYNVTDVIARIYHFWNDDVIKLSKIDAANKKAYLSAPTSLTVGVGNAYCLENVKEALDKPGEWYADKKLGKIYYIPFEDERIDSTVIYAGRLERLITVDNTSGLSFKNIIFENTNWNVPVSLSSQAGLEVSPCIYITNSTGIDFENCEFTDFGSTCIKYGANVKDSTVSGCYFHDIGAQAVIIAGDNVSLTDERLTKNIKVTNNHVYNYGKKCASSVAILQTYANSCEISHNEIHGGAYTAISVGWTWGEASTPTCNNKICDNLIYDIGHDALSDMGGIYTLGVQDGTVISGNVIFNVAAGKDASTYGGWGIYLDEGSAFIEVKDNLAYRCDSQGFHQHYGRENNVHNNIFALNKEGQVRSSRIVNGYNNFMLNGNILLGDDQLMYQLISEKKFTDNGNLYFDLAASKGLVYSGDDYASTAGPNNKDIEAVKKMGYYNNAVFADPCFIDIANGNFGFESSVAKDKIGFTAHDFSSVGSPRFASSYLVNRLPKNASYYPKELWNEYLTAKNAAVKNRNDGTISELMRAYNALLGYNGSSLTIENSSQWVENGMVGASSYLSVSGVDDGVGLGTSGENFSTDYPNRIDTESVKVRAASKNDVATATYYADRSVYSDMEQTPVRVTGGITETNGQRMRYYCTLRQTDDYRPSYGTPGGTTSSGIYYSLDRGGWNHPFLGKDGGNDVRVSADSYGSMTARLKGAIPAAGTSAKIRIAAEVLIACEKVGYYYCVNNFIDLTIIGVDKAALREMYGLCKISGLFTEAQLKYAENILYSDAQPQSEIDAAYNSLLNMYKSASGKTDSSDKEALKAQLDEKPSFSSATYTAESWSAYYKALTAAQEIYADRFASQSEIDSARTNLENAYNSLIDCSVLITSLSKNIVSTQQEAPQYAWYSYCSIKRGAISELVDGTPQRIAETANRVSAAADELNSKAATGITVTNYQTTHKYDNVLYSTKYYMSGVNAGNDYSNFFNFEDYPNQDTLPQFNLNVASPNDGATAAAYVDRSLYTDLSQTGIRIGASMEKITGQSIRLYLMFVDNHTPTISNRDSKTVNGNKYTLEVGTYNNPVIGRAGGHNVDNPADRRMDGKSGRIFGAVPNVGESATMEIAACSFVTSYKSTEFFCADSYITFTVYGVDKSLLREYAFDKYSTAPMPQTSYDEKSYAAYTAALNAALDMIYSDNCPQAEIDKASSELKAAYDALVRTDLSVSLDAGSGLIEPNLAVLTAKSFDGSQCGYPSFSGHKCKYTVSDNVVSFTPDGVEQGYAFLPMHLYVDPGETYTLTLKTSSNKLGCLLYNSSFANGWSLFPQFYTLANIRLTADGNGGYDYSADVTISEKETVSGAYLRLETAGTTDTVTVSDISLVKKGGAVPSCSFPVSTGDIVSLPVPERFGYSFEGWITDDGKRIDSDYIELNDKSISLTAEWSQSRVLVSTGTLTVDYDNRLVYGVTVGAKSLDGLVRVKDSSCTLSFDIGDVVHTGSRIDVLKNGKAVESYTVVVFGDVNGDGLYDGRDAVVVNCIASGMLDLGQISLAERFAADCNHDGGIDSRDAELLEQAGVLLEKIEQGSTSVAEATSIEPYLCMVDQLAVMQEADEPAVMNPLFVLFDRVIFTIVGIIKSLISFFE